MAQNEIRKNPSIKTVLSDPVHFLAFGFGSGLAPKAPGTFGSLAAMVFIYFTTELTLTVYLAITFAICLTGIYLCGESAKRLKTHDHPGIVWDEFAGIFITFAGFSLSLENLIAGFILFRIFDILKPWPIKWVDQKVTGGFGIMLDDIIAGGFAWLGLFGLNYLW